MSLPRCYLTKTNNFNAMMNMILSTEIPDYFDTKFLQEMGFDDCNDKNIVTLFKALGLLHGNNVPTMEYQKIRSPKYGRIHLAEIIRKAYSDVFDKYKDAQYLSAKDTLELFRQLCPKDSARTLEQKGRTFRYLCKYADWGTSLDSSMVENPHTPDIDTWAYLIDQYIPHLLNYYETNMERNHLGSIDNEKMLQSILYEHLKGMFSSVIKEKFMEAGYTYRKPDFFIPDLDMALEVKHTRSISNSTALGDQVAADITHYSSRYIYFFIYDKTGIIKDPEFFKSQYEGYSSSEKRIHVTIVPQS